MRLVAVAVSSVIAGVIAYWIKLHGNLSMMRFFRDLSRYKARKRLHGNKDALIPLLLHTEKVVFAEHMTPTETHTETQIESEKENDEKTEYFSLTLTDLAAFNGETATTPIYVSLAGWVFDVSVARETYGPGKSYHALVAKDATKAFATGCLDAQCLLALETHTLTAEEEKEVQRWLDFYHNHDKYELVGRLDKSDVVDALVERELHDDKERENAAGESVRETERKRETVDHAVEATLSGAE